MHWLVGAGQGTIRLGRAVRPSGRLFPSLCRSSDRCVNMNKTHNWWKKREETAAKQADPNQLKYFADRQRVRHQFTVRHSAEETRYSAHIWSGCTRSWLARFGIWDVQVSSCQTNWLQRWLSSSLKAAIHMFNTRFTVNGNHYVSLLTPRRIQDFLKRFCGEVTPNRRVSHLSSDHSALLCSALG